MAILFCRAQVIRRGDGRSSVAAAAYRSGADLLDERTGQRHDYRRKGGILAHGILAPEDAPAWVHDPQRLWNAVEKAEDQSTRRQTAQLARELVIALPHELDDPQREDLLKTILRTATRQGMVAHYSIHGPSRRGDERNHHAHVMLTMRRLTAQGFGAKVREWNERKALETWKAAIEQETNRLLARHGHGARVRVALEPGQSPTRHLGPAVSVLERQGIQTEPGNRNRDIEAENRERRKRQQALEALAREMEELDALQAARQRQTWRARSSPGRPLGFG